MNIRKFILLLPTLLSVCLLSCIRDEDRQMLNHNFIIQGEIDPNIGIPVAYGEMNLEDLMSMIPEEGRSYVSVGDNKLISLVYRYEFHEQYSAGGSKVGNTSKGSAARHAAAKDNSQYHWDTTLTYTEKITIFDSIAGLAAANDFGITQLLVSFRTWMEANANLETFNRMGVDAAIDNVQLSYKDKNGTPKPFHLNMSDSYSISNLLHSDTLTLLNNTDLSVILEDLPREVTISLRFNVDLTEDLFRFDISDLNFQGLLDSLDVSTLDVYGLFDVKFPLNIFVKEYPYNFDLTLRDTIAEIDWDSITEGYGRVVVDTIRLVMHLDNGFPFQFKINPILLDANDHELFSVMGSDSIVYGAPVRPFGNDGLYVANGSMPNTINIGLNTQQIKLLSRAKKIRLRLSLSTSGAENRSHVAVKTDDYLRVRLYLQLHPHAYINFPIDIDGSSINFPF